MADHGLPWPSPATATALVEGELGPREELRLVGETDGLVAFGDGIGHATPACAPQLRASTPSACDAQEVLLAVKRIVVRPRPPGDRAGDRLVAVERGLQHTLAPRQRREPLAQTVHVRNRDVALDRACRAADRRGLRNGV